MKLRKIIIAPDSFKGTLSAKTVADIVADEAVKALPGCTIVKIPIADGGEGSLETIMSCARGRIFQAQVLSPDDRVITASYGIMDDSTAILEMAQSSGLTKQTWLHPLTSSTYGFGQLISAALDRGARSFVLCIGGSATTDGGCGMAAALGVEFTDAGGARFIPCGGTLRSIAVIDMSGLDPRVRESAFTVMCDVSNPLYGTDGAAYVYGPQKGAGAEDIRLLDRGLRNFAKMLRAHFGASADFAGFDGAGAAGGLGAGSMAFLGASLVSGSEAILELCGFKDHVADADLVITGEGRLDAQSFSGKALSGILRASTGVPVCSICGTSSCTAELLERHGLKVFQACEGVSAEESMNEPEKHLRLAAKRALEYFVRNVEFSTNDAKHFD